MTALRSIAYAVALPALALALAVPGVARAGGTSRYDDGTRETAVRNDWTDGIDSVWDHFQLPAGTARGSTGATLWVYAEAVGCAIPGNAQRLQVNGYPIATFDPCTTFPETDYGWHGFDVPIEYVTDSDWVTVYDSDGRDERPGASADYAVDTSSFGHSTITQHDLTGWHDITGELMWYLELTGSVPVIRLSAGTLDLGLHGVGTTTTSATVTVTSDGVVDLSPNLTVTGDADFAVSADTCTGQTLPQGSSCTFRVTFTPTAAGSHWGSVVISPGTDRTVALHGEAPAPPPETTVTTADGAVLLPGDRVSGTVTSVSSLDHEWVTYRGLDPGTTTTGIRATTSCDAQRTACDWSVDDLRTPGRYAVTAYGTDSQGNVEAAGPPITVTVV
jgi:hypothetical protein